MILVSKGAKDGLISTIQTLIESQMSKVFFTTEKSELIFSMLNTSLVFGHALVFKFIPKLITIFFANFRIFYFGAQY